MNKTAIIFGSAIALSIAGFFTYRAYVPPKLVIENYDAIKKEGFFRFGKSFGDFGVNKGGSSKGYAKWVVTYGNENGEYVFKLYKNGEFIKVLKTFK